MAAASSLGVPPHLPLSLLSDEWLLEGGILSISDLANINSAVKLLALDFINLEPTNQNVVRGLYLMVKDMHVADIGAQCIAHVAGPCVVGHNHLAVWLSNTQNNKWEMVEELLVRPVGNETSLWQLERLGWSLNRGNIVLGGSEGLYDSLPVIKMLQGTSHTGNAAHHVLAIIRTAWHWPLLQCGIVGASAGYSHGWDLHAERCIGERCIGIPSALEFLTQPLGQLNYVPTSYAWRTELPPDAKLSPTTAVALLLERLPAVASSVEQVVRLCTAAAAEWGDFRWHHALQVMAGTHLSNKLRVAAMTTTERARHNKAEKLMALLCMENAHVVHVSPASGEVLLDQDFVEMGNLNSRIMYVHVGKVEKGSKWPKAEGSSLWQMLQLGVLTTGVLQLPAYAAALTSAESQNMHTSLAKTRLGQGNFPYNGVGARRLLAKEARTYGACIEDLRVPIKLRPPLQLLQKFGQVCMSWTKLPCKVALTPTAHLTWAIKRQVLSPLPELDSHPFFEWVKVCGFDVAHVEEVAAVVLRGRWVVKCVGAWAKVVGYDR